MSSVTWTVPPRFLLHPLRRFHPHYLPHLRRFGGFEQVVVKSGGEGFFAILGLAIAGEGDEQRLRREGLDGIKPFPFST